MKPVLTITSDEISTALAKVKAATDKSWPEILRSNGRLVAVNLGIQTQPYGKDKAAQDKGINAVRRDVGKVYAVQGEIYSEIEDAGDEKLAKAFYVAMEKGRTTSAGLILRKTSIPSRNVPVAGGFDGGAAHKANRNRRGRVSRRVAALVVPYWGDVDKYLKAKVKLVGFAKGGWATCAKILGGTRGLPGWVSRQKSPGSVIENYSPNNPSVTMTNSVRYIDTILPAYQIKEALRIQAEKMIAYADKLTGNAFKKAGFK